MAGSSGARSAGVAMKAIPLSVAFEVASGSLLRKARPIRWRIFAPAP